MIAAPELNSQSIEPMLEEMRAKSQDELRQVVRDGLRMISESYLRMALALRVLEEGGDDLEWAKEELDMRTYSWLRKIGHNQMLAKVVVAFNKNKDAVDAVSKLPLPDQEKVVKNRRVNMVVVTGAGKTDTIKADVAGMEREQLRQVFDGGRIREEAEQRLWLEAKRQVVATTPEPEKFGPFEYDRERDVILFLGKRGDPVSPTIIKQLNAAIKRRERRGG